MTIFATGGESSMGFKDANWATTLDADWPTALKLTFAQKAVLLAICLRTDDRTHETIVGHDNVARMLGASTDTVRRALSALEDRGLLARSRRHGPGGYRTSDQTVVNSAYQAQSLEGGAPTRQTTYKAEGRDLTGTQPPPTRQSAGAEEINQLDQPDDQSDNVQRPIDLESEFAAWYQLYPRKQARADALKAYRQARKTASAKELLDGLQTYVLSTIGVEKEHVKLPAGWLRAERWSDEPVAITPDRDRGYKRTRDEANLPVVRELAARERENDCPTHPGYPTPCERCARETA